MHAMPRFFVDSSAVSGAMVRIEGRSAEHLARSLRARVGDTIVVVEDGRTEHGVTIEAVTPSRVRGRIDWSRAATGEPRTDVHVLQAIPARGMDDAVEAIAAAGARAVWPVLTERGVARPDPRRSGRRAERWTAIAREAAQLAGRAGAPVVHPVLELGDALAALPPGCRILACVTDDGAGPLRTVGVRPDTPVALVIGPEGGLGPRDIETVRAAGAEPVHLGARVLPSRLAGFLAVSLLLAAAGDLDEAATPPPEPERR